MPGRLSVALIVRNEAEHLAGCLEGASAFADEICVVDTGSTDATISIAERQGVEPVSFPWCDDFAAARNRSLELCRFPWIFVIDADERVAPEDVPVLRALVEEPPARGYRFVTRNYTNNAAVSEFRRCPPDDAHGRGFAGWFPSAKVRLFPNRPDVRFEGAVHELVNGALERVGIPILTSDIPIHHYAEERSAERLQAKRLLYLELGQRKAAQDPHDAKARIELGRQYAELGRYAEAAASYREALRAAPRDPEALRELGTALHLLGRNEEAEKALRLATKLDGEQAEAWRNLGVVLTKREAWDEALACFERARTLDPGWSDGLRYASVALQRLGRVEEGRRAARQALEENPRDRDCLNNFLAQVGDGEEARAVLERLRASGVETVELREALERLRQRAANARPGG